MIAGFSREDRMSLQSKLGMFALGSALVCLLGAVPSLAQSPDTERMSWLLNRGGLEDLALTGQRFEQGEIGGGGAGVEVTELETFSGRKKSGWPVLFSLILPGAGEASMGYTRGYFMMAADIFAWTQVAKYHSDGGDLKDEYIIFADAHYTDERLVEGYDPGSTDVERAGEGAIYFPNYGPIFNVEGLGNPEYGLPLYVSKEDDFREYYENLGKWDQFIFGWDDYTRASIAYPDIGYEPTLTRADLQHSWVSPNRDKYRLMRDASNDAYLKRDRWLYVNIGLRVFSVLQTAYLAGLLGGDPGEELEVAGHAVQIIAQPAGWDKGALAASVSF
jgi:hypothetical protein